MRNQYFINVVNKDGIENIEIKIIENASFVVIPIIFVKLAVKMQENQLGILSLMVRIAMTYMMYVHNIEMVKLMQK